jgi:hypothetical protein
MPLSVGAGAGGAHMGGLLRGGPMASVGGCGPKKKKSVCADRVKKCMCGPCKKEKKSACAGYVKNKRG